MFAPRLLLMFIAAAWCLPRSGIAQGSGHSLSLQAVVRSSGGGGGTAGDVKVGSGTGSAKSFTQTQERDRAVGLEVEVRNLARVADKAKLEWYFYAKPITGASEVSVFDQGSSDLTIEAGSSSKLTVTSKELHSSVERKSGPSGKGKTVKAPKNTVEKTGDKLAGWLVRVVADGKPIAIKASSPTFERLGAGDPVAVGK
jgi:hypothetical protein